MSFRKKISKSKFKKSNLDLKCKFRKVESRIEIWKVNFKKWISKSGFQKVNFKKWISNNDFENVNFVKCILQSEFSKVFGLNMKMTLGITRHSLHHVSVSKMFNFMPMFQAEYQYILVSHNRCSKTLGKTFCLSY